ncbi:MAG: DinB family protein [Bernardetiaceae bacterium]|nr:DinB family protein [Bernardetiaceae bacterium]
MPKDLHLIQISRRIDVIIEHAHHLHLLNSKQLKYKPDAKSWNILECLWHLITSNQGYIDMLEKYIVEAKKNNIQGRDKYKPSWAEIQFIHQIKPQNHKSIPAPLSLRPNLRELTLMPKVIDDFEKQLAHLKKLCLEADGIDLKKAKIPMPLFKLIRMRMGSAFEIVVLHNERHFVQIQKLLAAQPELSKVKETFANVYENL